ncbi:MAG: oligosaccharide flippase family protein, partial [Candidatus Omnitrophica bacterium]|nr:oligosaccharide flippase family protein [Candidatus Omnitrophota bacterium]
MIDYLKKSLVTYASQILRLLLVVGSNIIIARYLGPSGKGILTLIMSFLSIVVMLGMVGLDEANVYFISSKKTSHRIVFTHALYQSIVLSGLCLVIFVILRDWMLHNVLKGITLQYFYILLVLIPFYSFNQHTRTMLLGHKSIYSFNLYVIAQFLILFIMHLVFIPIYGLFGGVLSIIVT